MKVAAIVGNTDGGMVHYSSQLSNALATSVDVVVFGPDGLNREYFDERVTVEEIPHNRFAGSFGRNMMSVSNLVRAVRNTNPDLIHILSPHIAIASALPLFGRYPLVVTLHDPIPPTPAQKLGYHRILLDELVNRAYIRLADKLVVHGEALMNVMLDRGIHERSVTVIPHGNYAFFTEWRKEGVSEESDTVLFFGFLAKHKGLRYLFEAEEAIASSVDDLNIIVAGKGDLGRYEAYMTDIDNYEIHNEFVPNEMVAELFQRASIVVLPYTSATQSGVLPIAYPFGTPVVVTDVGSLPEVVDHGETGYVVPPRDSAALADTIIKLLTNDERREKMGETAAEKAYNDLSWHRIRKLTVEMYERVLDCRG